MAQSLPTYFLNATSVAARNAEMAVSGQFAGGMNLAGSNAPGVGINTAGYDPKLQDWSTEDQHAAARVPQDSAHIGNTGLGAGTEGVGTIPLNAVIGADLNDTLSFIVALAQAAPGVGFGAVNANPINRSSRTIEIGDRAWGTNTVT